MSEFLETLANIGRYLPSIEAPKVKPNLKSRIYTTFFIAVLYLVLSNVYVFGLVKDYPKIKLQKASMTFILLLIGSNIGTLTSLGVGPIVVASIMLTLLSGSKIIEIDLSDNKGRRIYHNAERTLMYIFCVIEAISFTIGMYRSGLLILAPPVSITLPLVIIQFIIGGFIIILLDEYIAKYGISSGISLFIFLGVIQSIFIFALFPLAPSGLNQPVGALPKFLSYLSSGMLNNFVLATTLVPLVTMIIVFVVSLYLWMVRVEIPVTHVSFRGQGAKIPLNLMYTNVIPLIFVIMIFNILISLKPLIRLPLYTEFVDYFIQSPSGLLGYYTLYQQNIWLFLEHILCFGISVLVLSVVFSFFWVYSAGMDAETLADQIMDMGMQVSGFRRDKRALVRILNRYIPAITFLSAVFTALIIIFSEALIGGWVGTGIFLTAGIAYSFYEELKREKGIENYEFIRYMLNK